jgi:RNA polymerase sigma factor (sigma-70 family)
MVSTLVRRVRVEFGYGRHGGSEHFEAVSHLLVRRRAIVGPSEHLLVWRLRRGDRDACRELIRIHHAAVYAYLRRLGADASCAEDLTQETYMRAWRNIESLRRTASLRSWLLTIARNEFFQQMRAGRIETVGLEQATEGASGNPRADDVVARSERDGAGRAPGVRREPELREMIALHYFQDLSFREVAEVLGVPPGTAKSRVHSALLCLRALLGKEAADHERQRTDKALAKRS